MNAAHVPQSLRSTAKNYWRSFLPMWVLPVFVFLLVLLPAWSTHAELIFFLLVVPAFAVSMYLATRPIRRGQVGFGHTAFWAVLVPFLVWAAVIFGIFGLAFALGAA